MTGCRAVLDIAGRYEEIDCACDLEAEHTGPHRSSWEQRSYDGGRWVRQEVTVQWSEKAE